MAFDDWLNSFKKTEKNNGSSPNEKGEVEVIVTTTVEKDDVTPESVEKNDKENLSNIFSLTNMLSAKIGKHLYTDKPIDEECLKNIYSIIDKIKNLVEDLK